MRSLGIFFDLDGRLDRERWLGAAAVLVCLFVLVWLGAVLGLRLGVISVEGKKQVMLFTWAFLSIFWVVIDWKRFQDLALWGGFALVCPVLTLINLKLTPWSSGLETYPTGLMMLFGVMHLAATVAALWLLAFKKGKEHPAKPRIRSALGAEPVLEKVCLERLRRQ
jgi:hypothetical protein